MAGIPTRRRGGVRSAADLWRALEPQSDPKITEALDHSARVLDIGRSLDFVARHELVANILLSTELNGFTHEELALVAALVRRAGDRHADTRVFGPLITETDRPQLHRAAVVLALADEIEARCPHRRPIGVTCRVGRNVTVSVPLLCRGAPRISASASSAPSANPWSW
jgi:exopolyphosphatase/pppGpp-phosphohydrolase